MTKSFSLSTNDIVFFYSTEPHPQLRELHCNSFPVTVNWIFLLSTFLDFSRSDQKHRYAQGEEGVGEISTERLTNINRD